MKIAMLSPIAWRTPPLGYGPWEWVVLLLTEGLAVRGIDVTLFATADSVTQEPYVSGKPLTGRLKKQEGSLLLIKYRIFYRRRFIFAS